jgi:hypothetical protein
VYVLGRRPHLHGDGRAVVGEIVSDT